MENDRSCRRTARPNPGGDRVAFLILAPLSIVAGYSHLLCGAVSVLRPLPPAASDKWIDVAPISAPTGAQSLRKEVEQIAGWAISSRSIAFTSCPQNNPSALAVCRTKAVRCRGRQIQTFSCPCHESYFAADGSKLKGPAQRGLDPLPTRLQDGKLQVQYRSFENNTAERIPRA
jgi:Rieske Fe-S protein